MTTRDAGHSARWTCQGWPMRVPREAEAEEWLAANRKAINAYNTRVERDGVWSDKLRGF